MTRRQIWLSALLTLGFAAAVFVALDRPGALPLPVPVAAQTEVPGFAWTSIPRDTGRSLRIDSIEVDAPLQARQDSALDDAVPVPDNPVEVGWHRFLDTGEGADHALLLGHVNWRDGSAGVFGRLHEVARGDLIEVRDGGRTTVYRVTAARQVDALGTSLADILGRGETDTVTLMTCSGEYLWDHGTYAERTVVTAIRSDAPPERASS